MDSVPDNHLDWVVVLRMLQQRKEPVNRGRRRGPTAAERWVWYCTIVTEYGYNWEGWGLRATLEAARRAGETRNWPFMTLEDVVANLDSQAYHDGTLFPYVKRKAA